MNGDNKTSDMLYEKCQRFRYAHSWVSEQLYDAADPDKIDNLINATFTIYQPDKPTSQQPCDALEQLVGKNPVEKLNYCRGGKCLVLDVINDVSEKEEPLKE